MSCGLHVVAQGLASGREGGPDKIGEFLFPCKGYGILAGLHEHYSGYDPRLGPERTRREVEGGFYPVGRAAQDAEGRIVLGTRRCGHTQARFLLYGEDHALGFDTPFNEGGDDGPCSIVRQIAEDPARNARNLDSCPPGAHEITFVQFETWCIAVGLLDEIRKALVYLEGGEGQACKQGLPGHGSCAWPDFPGPEAGRRVKKLHYAAPGSGTYEEVLAELLAHCQAQGLQEGGQVFGGVVVHW